MKNSKILKALAYILIPLLLVALSINLTCVFYISDNKDFVDKDNYLETSQFANRIYHEVNQIQYYIVNVVNPYEDTNSVNVFEHIYGKNIGFEFLLIRKNDNSIFTNINTSLDNIEEVKNELKKDNYYFFYNNEIDTNIKNSELKNKYYINTYRDIEFEIYIAFSDETDVSSEAFFEKVAFDYAKSNEYNIVYTIPIYIVLVMILVIYLLWSIGHRKGEEQIYQTKFDKWPIEVILAIGISADLFFTWLAYGILDNIFYYETVEINILMFSFAAIILSIIYAITAIIGTSFIKKLKTGTLIKTSLVYIICRKIVIGIKNICKVTFGNLNINLKFLGTLLALIIITAILCAIFGGFGMFLSIIIYGVVIYFIMKKLYQFSKIKLHLKEMYYGNTMKSINLQEYKGELKEIAIYINEISNGLENAVNEKLKSERLKTELITNVSHDIKTPLTSIINYVDLLKQEDIKDEKIKEYVDILDNKSQRLKKLIEDLVEASKVSSGNIKLDKQKINLVELINQTVGEFSDKFNEKNLNVLVNTNKKEEYNIQADTRYMYRVVENLFSNIYKYSLEGSRVYIDINEEKQKIKLEIKNISKEALNITEDELMERFVRGDKSRNTEGSGLGLSIAKSLTELQNGEFNIIIDGDLFKVEVCFFK